MTGTVPGATPQERAVRLAGALAELGIVHLALIQAGQAPEPLATRRTDLPGLLSKLADATLESPGLRLRVTSDSLTWACADPALADRLSAALVS